MIVTLLTDFGVGDYFVGAMKGAVLSVNPQAQIVDITHDIPAHDIEAGAFTLRAAYETFPVGTIHVAVVDPGVGSSRRAVVARGSGGHLFVGPDNGVLGHVYERTEGLRVFQLTKREFFREPVSATFHGRDIFAPVAGALSRGVAPETLGEEIEDFVRLPQSTPLRNPDCSLTGAVIHIDRFGNCVTNITPQDLSVADIESGARILVGDCAPLSLRDYFAVEENSRGEPFAIWGSAGFLEIAIYCDSAARALGIERGQTVVVQGSPRKVRR